MNEPGDIRFPYRDTQWGLWGEPPWWEGAEFQQDYDLTLEAIRARTDCLKRHFSRAWLAEQAEAGIPQAILGAIDMGSGHMPFMRRMSMAQTLQLTEGLPGFEAVKANLMTQATATLHELVTAGRFVEVGFEVAFVPRANDRKSPDLALTLGGQSLAVECKTVQREKWEIWAEALSMRVLDGLGADQKVAGVNVAIEFNSRLAELNTSDDALNRHVLDAIAARMRSALTEALGRPEPLGEHLVPGIGRLVVTPGEPGGSRGEAGGIVTSRVAKLRRLIQNGVLTAWEQVAASSISGIVVKMPADPDPALFEVVMEGVVQAYPDMKGRLLFVAVVDEWTTFGGARQRFETLANSILWRNPRAMSGPWQQDVITRVAEAIPARRCGG